MDMELISQVNKCLDLKSFITKHDNALLNINQDYYKRHNSINKVLKKYNECLNEYRLAYIDNKFCVINNITNELEVCFKEIEKSLIYIEEGMNRLWLNQ